MPGRLPTAPPSRIALNFTPRNLPLSFSTAKPNLEADVLGRDPKTKFLSFFLSGPATRRRTAVTMKRTGIGVAPQQCSLI